MAAAIAAIVAALTVARPWHMLAQSPEPAKGVTYAQLNPAEIKEWLTYLSSDELQGRQIFTEGYGLAASYVADHLKEWRLKPLGDNGTYFQPVKLNGYKVTRNSSVTVEVNGKSQTFTHGSHVTFPVNSGGKQTLTISGAEFVGAGQTADYQGHDVKNKAVVWVPARTAPNAGGRGAAAAGAAAAAARPLGGNGSAAALSTLGAKASLGYAAAPPPPTSAEEALTNAQAALAQATQAVAQAQQQVQGRGGAAAAGRGAATGRGATPVAPAAAGRGAAGAPPSAPDLTTVLRVDAAIPPQITGDDTFFEFLFSGSSVPFADLKAKADAGESLPKAALANVKLTFNIDNTFELLSTQLSKNVVAMVEGTDPKLKDTYVMFGAHLDHIGYRPAGGRLPGTGNCRRTAPAVGTGAPAPAVGSGAPAAAVGSGAPATTAAGRGAPVTASAPLPPLAAQDIINNGADDDGSGSTALMAIAKAFATGPKPKRSVVFVWHTGEESGLYGSRYNADFPVVPLDRVQTQLNIDMIGRDDCDNLNGDYSNSVFVVGADRISTDHNLIVDTDAAQARPLTLDYELNDPADPESVYTRSDHYSYASKGIPIAFFTTGLHKDYHQVSDSVDKILFPKLARIAQLVYETGFSVANTERVLERDNKGPRTGKGFAGKIPR
jgi:hypothetical protein